MFVDCMMKLKGIDKEILQDSVVWSSAYIIYTSFNMTVVVKYNYLLLLQTLINNLAFLSLDKLNTNKSFGINKISNMYT